jgi:hypothetical protein
VCRRGSAIGEAWRRAVPDGRIVSAHDAGSDNMGVEDLGALVILLQDMPESS